MNNDTKVIESGVGCLRFHEVAPVLLTKGLEIVERQKGMTKEDVVVECPDTASYIRGFKTASWAKWVLQRDFFRIIIFYDLESPDCFVVSATTVTPDIQELICDVECYDRLLKKLSI